MKNETILIKAIDKALKNGMVDDIPHSMFSLEFETWNWHNTIFSHDFAKAFWGEEEFIGYADLNKEEQLVKCIPSWQHHLQAMVLEKNPVKYLKTFL